MRMNEEAQEMNAYTKEHKMDIHKQTNRRSINKKSRGKHTFIYAVQENGESASAFV